MADIIRDVDAIPGERWFPKKTTFVEDIEEYWGDWGVASEVDTLKAVLLRRPGREIENFDPKKARFSDDPVDVELLRKQPGAARNATWRRRWRSWECPS